MKKGVGPALSGIYALYFRGKLVYIGKASKGTTKSKRTLRSRLNEHVSKIEDRRNITVAEMQCRYLTFDSEWWVFAAEFALITHYKPEWNASGFGSKMRELAVQAQIGLVGGTIFSPKKSVISRSQLSPFLHTIQKQ